MVSAWKSNNTWQLLFPFGSPAGHGSPAEFPRLGARGNQSHRRRGAAEPIGRGTSPAGGTGRGHKDFWENKMSWIFGVISFFGIKFTIVK